MMDPERKELAKEVAKEVVKHTRPPTWATIATVAIGVVGLVYQLNKWSRSK